MDKIIWRGIDSSTIPGLIICELPPITKPKMKTSITKIDGRDGDIVEELGYESYTKSINIGLARNYKIDEIIKYFTGTGMLEMSNEPNKIYNCKIVDKIDYEKLLRFKKAVVKFYTQPFKYLKNEKIIELSVTDETSLVVDNIGLELAKPIMTIEGTGTIEISVNNNTVFNAPPTYASINVLVIVPITSAPMFIPLLNKSLATIFGFFCFNSSNADAMDIPTSIAAPSEAITIPENSKSLKSNAMF